MTREEIITALETINANPLTKESIKEAFALQKAHNQLVREEEQKALEDHISAGGNPDEFEPPKHELDQAWEQLWKTFLNNKRRFDEQQTREAEENLKDKEAIIEEIEKLKDEENIKKAFTKFKVLEEKWKEIGFIPKDKYRELHSRYSRARDEFFYTMHIYRELLEHDLKKNLQEKWILVDEMKALLKMNNIREMERLAREYTHKWNEIGPTYHDKWEEVRNAFWEAHHEVYVKVKNHFKTLKEKQTENLEKKKEILARLLDINKLEKATEKKWKRLTKEVIELQKKWKEIGPAPKSENEKIWQQFKEAADKFFSDKSVFYHELKKVKDANKAIKEKLVEQAEALKDSTEWKETTEKLKQLQRKWKETGQAHHRDEQRLWKRFRAACNTFFDAKNEQYKARLAQIEEMKGAVEENLKKKKAIIDKIVALEKDHLDELKKLATEFAETGFVPKDKKQEIKNAFNQAMQKKLKEMGWDEDKISEFLFSLKLKEISKSLNPGELLEKEGYYLQDKIKNLKASILQYENNIGFFGHSKGAEKLRQEVEQKLEQSKKQLQRYEKKLKLIMDKLKS